MKNGMIFSPEPKFSVGSSKALSNGSTFQKIDFHLARKPYTGIGNGDFRLETLNPNISSDSNKAGTISGLSSAMSGNKSDGSEVCDNGLDPELSFEITFRRIGAGLENLGNTCFLNSVLQCLTYTEPLAAYLQSGKHQNSCRIAGFCALCAIQKHVSRALQSSGRILTPKDLVSNLRCISRNFRNSRQEDAHECMVSLLESMHKCCLPSGVPSESPGAYEKSLVHKIFGGRLRSQVKCMQCSYCSNTYDPFLDLSLEIVRADSVHKALMHFTATEQLDGGERQYQCQSCKQKVKALKQLTVYKAPYVLTVHLKRFRAHDPGQKIDKKVQFGPSLDLKPFFSGSHEGNLTYTLYGVLVHAGGTTHSGHYYCFVRTSSGMWYSLDDNRVFQVSERTVLEQKAYMLFYYRDRGIVASKKPVLGIQKENVAANGLRNKMVTIPNHSLKGTVQNGFFEKRFGGLDTSAAVTQSDVLNIGSVKETQQNETSTQKSNGPTMASNSDTQVESPIGPVSKDPVKEISVQNPKGGESLPLPLSVPSAQGSGDNSNFCNYSSASTTSKLNGCSEEKNSRDDLSVAVSIRPILSSPQNPAIEKLVIDKTSKKRNTVSEIGVPSKSPFGENDGKSSGLIGSTKSPKEPNNENSQVEGTSNGKATGASHTDNAAHAGMKLSVNGLAESSSSSITTNGSLHPNATNESLHVIAPDQKPHLKLKKKFLKYRVVSLHLGSNILFGSPFLRKKKKHKCSRKRTLGNETLNSEQLEEIDLGPSTSEKTGATYPSSTRPRKKKVKSCSTDQDIGKSSVKEVPKSNGDLSLEIKGEFNNRTDHNGALPATDKSPDESSSNSSSLAANQCDARKPDGLKNASRASMQNGLMSMLTRGLEETIVARWDGIDLPPYHEIESRVLEANGIGYVADEWDEEYDRGKRKKVRHSKDDFGGPNPFQEIATKKAQSKKARIERLSSGNQPFRI